MNKYNTHSDLAKESLELLKEGKHYKRFIEKMDNFSIETYEFLEDTDYLKNPSLEVITIFFRTTFKPFLSICRFYRLFLYF